MNGLDVLLGALLFVAVGLWLNEWRRRVAADKREAAAVQAQTWLQRLADRRDRRIQEWQAEARRLRVLVDALAYHHEPAGADPAAETGSLTPVRPDGGAA